MLCESICRLDVNDTCYCGSQIYSVLYFSLFWISRCLSYCCLPDFRYLPCLNRLKMAILAPLWWLGMVSAVTGKWGMAKPWPRVVLWTHWMKPHPCPPALLKYSVNVHMIWLVLGANWMGERNCAYCCKYCSENSSHKEDKKKMFPARLGLMK